MASEYKVSLSGPGFSISATVTAGCAEDLAILEEWLALAKRRLAAATPQSTEGKEGGEG